METLRQQQELDLEARGLPTCPPWLQAAIAGDPSPSLATVSCVIPVRESTHEAERALLVSSWSIPVSSVHHRYSSVEP
jgi:hypothetical protein